MALVHGLWRRHGLGIRALVRALDAVISEVSSSTRMVGVSDELAASIAADLETLTELDERVPYIWAFNC